jgi:20S proteasome alpha/beta subunit
MRVLNHSSSKPNNLLNNILILFILSISIPITKCIHPPPFRQNLQSTGTTLVSLARPNFIVLACDSRTTMGNYISSDQTVKVRRIRGNFSSSQEDIVANIGGRSTTDQGDFVYLLGAGVSGDVVDVVHLLRDDVEEEYHKSQIKTPFPTWKLSRSTTEDYVLDGQRECACVVGARIGGKLGLKLVETSGGTRYINAPAHTSVGSGSLASTAYLDVYGGEALSVEECVACAVEAVKRGVENDDSSGGIVRVTLIERGRVWEGCTKEEGQVIGGEGGKIEDGVGSRTRTFENERELTLLSEEVIRKGS